MSNEIIDYTLSVQYVAKLRKGLAVAKIAKEAMENAYKESAEYLIYEEAKETLAAAESELRRSAISNFENDQNKNPHPAITIKMITQFDVADAKAALAYCKSDLPQALTFDKKVFKKVILALDESSRPDCVKISTEPRADIKADLSKYIKQEEDNVE